MRRKICYISGTRADFGLMRSTLDAIAATDDLSLSVIVTGMHLSAAYGNTVDEIRDGGFHIAARIPVDTAASTGATMARNIAQMLSGFIDALTEEKPDLVLLLGDRGEMIAGALAAVHLNIPVAHIHGGERSGTVDEPVRHAISKLSHFHFTSTVQARDRLIQMGEHPASVHVTGAPGLDGILDIVSESRAQLCREFGFDPAGKLAILVYHPVLQEAASAGADIAQILEILVAAQVQVVALKPNSDAGSDQIRQELAKWQSTPQVRVETHFQRTRFASLMAAADIMVGNSSAGIIEAASFGIPVVNIGSRQNLRERNINVVDVPMERLAIEIAVREALDHGEFQRQNIYGDGLAASRIVALLRSLVIDDNILMKTNAY